MLPWIAFGLAGLAAAMAVVNLRGLVRAGAGRVPEGVLVSILIPARDEAPRIGACVAAALASRGVAVEVVVMDDGSTDGTAAVVGAVGDPRLRLLAAPPLPPGWTGKVHACARLAEAARGTHLLFIDADVRLAPDAAARLVAHAEARGLGLVSGVPRQRMGTLGEGLTVPAINLLMLAYLPGGGRAASRRPALAAACGQLILVRRAAYEAAGGHAAQRHRLHDGLALARAMREAGARTEVVDGAPLAECRMYRGLREAWPGFRKNAREGMATPAGLPLWTILLGGGHILPWLLLPDPVAMAAAALSLLTRAAITRRTREPAWTIPLHPFTTATALAIQWSALLRARPSGWKGRAYEVRA